jgi:hypothetical protein
MLALRKQLKAYNLLLFTGNRTSTSHQSHHLAKLYY